MFQAVFPGSRRRIIIKNRYFYLVKMRNMAEDSLEVTC